MAWFDEAKKKYAGKISADSGKVRIGREVTHTEDGKERVRPFSVSGTDRGVRPESRKEKKE